MYIDFDTFNHDSPDSLEVHLVARDPVKGLGHKLRKSLLLKGVARVQVEEDMAMACSQQFGPNRHPMIKQGIEALLYGTLHHPHDLAGLLVTDNDSPTAVLTDQDICKRMVCTACQCFSFIRSILFAPVSTSSKV